MERLKANFFQESLERIKRIRLFRQLGFSIKEIKGILDSPNSILKSVLEEQIEKLREKFESKLSNIDWNVCQGTLC